MILRLSLRLRPWRPLLILSSVLAVSAVILGWNSIWSAVALVFLAALGASALTRARRDDNRGTP